MRGGGEGEGRRGGRKEGGKEEGRERRRGGIERREGEEGMVRRSPF